MAYTVKEIAAELNCNPETVRRWIRSGKLKADLNSRKEGALINEDDYLSFLHQKPKYVCIQKGIIEKPGNLTELETLFMEANQQYKDLLDTVKKIEKLLKSMEP